MSQSSKRRATSYIDQADLIYQRHMALGITLIMIFLFTRLIHIISAPVWYLGRRYQIIRQKKRSRQKGDNNPLHSD